MYDFSIDYGSIAADDILDIHKYLMKKKWYLIKMFGFVKQILISAITFFSCNALKCIQVNDQTCSEIVNVNSDEPVFYPNSVKINKCSGSCNNINYLYAKKCISDVVQDVNVKVYNLISRSNETRHIK